MLAAVTEQAQRARQRRRGEQLEAALLEAAWQELVEAGFARLTMESVAARAKTGVAVLYRRWPNKEALLVYAVATIKGDPPKISGTSVRDDLVTLLRPVGIPSHTRAGKIMPCLLSAMQRSPELFRCFEKISEPRRELMREVLRRGISQGELRADLDLDLVMVMLVGPVLAQAMLGWEHAGDRRTLPQRVVDALWPAIAAGPAPS